MKEKHVEVTLGFTVPAWVTYVAQDSDGDWFGWERKPKKDLGDNRWSNGGEMAHIASGHENPMWSTTLTEVP